MRFTAFCLRTPFVALLFLSLTMQLQAQANPTASKNTEIDMFGGYLNMDPGFGGKRDSGATVGVDFTHYFKRSPVIPALSFEARSNFVNGPVANERTYLFGFKAQTVVAHRYHPYADFLIGPGNIHFNQQSATSFNLIGDNSTVTSFGGGLDLDLTPHWQAKFDYQFQSWHAGSLQNYKPNGFTFGVVYRFPFKSFKNMK